jgi:hypothetical protein
VEGHSPISRVAYLKLYGSKGKRSAGAVLEGRIDVVAVGDIKDVTVAGEEPKAAGGELDWSSPGPFEAPPHSGDGERGELIQEAHGATVSEVGRRAWGRAAGAGDLIHRNQVQVRGALGRNNYGDPPVKFRPMGVHPGDGLR